MMRVTNSKVKAAFLLVFLVLISLTMIASDCEARSPTPTGTAIPGASPTPLWAPTPIPIPPTATATANASDGRSLAWYAAGSPPPAASPPMAHRPGTGCGFPLAGTRSPAAAEVPAGAASGAGSRPTTGWRSRQSRLPASGDHTVRRTGPGHPPYGLRSRRLPGECTTPASVMA